MEIYDNYTQFRDNAILVDKENYTLIKQFKTAKGNLITVYFNNSTLNPMSYESDNVRILGLKHIMPYQRPDIVKVNFNLLAELPKRAG